MFAINRKTNIYYIWWSFFFGFFPASNSLTRCAHYQYVKQNIKWASLKKQLAIINVKPNSILVYLLSYSFLLNEFNVIAVLEIQARSAKIMRIDIVSTSHILVCKRYILPSNIRKTSIIGSISKHDTQTMMRWSLMYF